MYCGFCAAVFRIGRRDTESSHGGFSKRCKCCGCVHNIHNRCAQVMYKKSAEYNNTTSTNVSPIDSTTFNKSTIKLHCFQCEQKKCFYCNKSHTGMLLYLIIFFTHLL